MTVLHSRDLGVESRDAWFRLVWEAAGDAMALSDPDGVVVAVNPAYCRLYGYGQEQVVGRSFSLIFPEETRAAAENEYRRVFREPVDPRGVESVVRRCDGTERRVDVRYTFLEEHGERVSMLSVIRDMTEQNRLRQVEEGMSRERDNFLLSVSHDLKNPLAGIIGHVQLLLRRLNREGSVNVETVRENLQQVEGTARRMAAMIDGLLDTVSAAVGEPMRQSQVDLVALVRTVAEAYGGAGETHRIVLETPPTLPGWWDERRLHRALDNLLSNAIKYSPRGGTITVAVREEQGSGAGMAVIRVSDEGIGIPESEIARIFDTFFRARNVSDEIAGSGIGLAGVRKTVELHGGTVTASSVEGMGTTVTIRLPRQ